MAGNNVHYWDSCLFLAWLKNETTRAPGDMDGVREIIEKVKRREIDLITSALTYAEVCSANLPTGVYNLFRELMKRRNITTIAVDVPIATFACELRAYYTARPGEFNNKTLSTPDAIHLATGIIYKVDEFHTFDRENKGKSLGLLPLNGNVAGHTLTICKPRARQMGMDV